MAQEADRLQPQMGKLTDGQERGKEDWKMRKRASLKTENGQDNKGKEKGLKVRAEAETGILVCLLLLWSGEPCHTTLSGSVRDAL